MLPACVDIQSIDAYTTNILDDHQVYPKFMTSDLAMFLGWITCVMSANELVSVAVDGVQPIGSASSAPRKVISRVNQEQ